MLCVVCHAGNAIQAVPKGHSFDRALQGVGEEIVRESSVK
jgi:hypothetical protein